MRDYGSMFLGLALAGIVLILLSLWLVTGHSRYSALEMARPALSELPSKASIEPAGRTSTNNS